VRTVGAAVAVIAALDELEEATTMRYPTLARVRNGKTSYGDDLSQRTESK
jgi:hypothetical protein